MSPENKLLQIAQRLVEKTQAGQATWEEGAAEGSFVTNFRQGSVVVTEDGRLDGYGDPVDGVEIAITNPSGSPIERLWIDENTKGYEILRALHVEARRDALKVNETLDDILGELD